MGAVVNIYDRMINFVANLGTDRDKASGGRYVFAPLDDQQLMSAYRGSWLPRKIVDIPALDSIRRWRDWRAEADAISAIEAEEKRLQLKAKVKQARQIARLYGGAAIYIGTGDQELARPLDAGRVRRGGIRFLSVIPRQQLAAEDIELDPESPYYGRPEFYILQTGRGGPLRIHASRLAVFIGAEVLDPTFSDQHSHGWGDSILNSVYEQVRQADSTSANIASLVFESKVDVIKIPGFMAGMMDDEYQKQLLQRISLAAIAKGNNGMLLLDAEEEYSSKVMQFSGLTDVLMAFMQLTSGAADIPMTRLLGQSPGGLQASGESDLKNYYDRVQSEQELEVDPALATLDECLIRSALGARPDEIYSEWRSLWQTSDEQKSKIGKESAETIKIIGETQLVPDEVLAQAAVNLMTERGVMPGLESLMNEYAEGRGLPEEETDPPDAQPVTDAKPRTLYVSRPVVNGKEIQAWAREQGFDSTLPAEDMHVTVAFSRAPVDWMKIDGHVYANSDGTLEISAGGPRLIETLGENGEAVVLLFAASELAWRHHEILEAGASWDWPDYQPHITISFAGQIPEGAEPYRGPIVLGPERFEELDENWREGVREEKS